MTPFRDIDWKETSALLAVLAVFLIPVRWVWRSFKRRLLVPVLAESLREVLAADLAPISVAAAKASDCAGKLEELVRRLEGVDDDITVLFDVAFGIDRRSWNERRQAIRAGMADRRRQSVRADDRPFTEDRP